MRDTHLVFTFFISLILCTSAWANTKSENAPNPHAALLSALESNNIKELSLLEDKYPWLEDYLVNILQTDLSFTDAIPDNKNKVELLEKLVKKIHFAPLEKTLLEKLIQTQKALDLNSSNYQKKLTELLDENPGVKDCDKNYSQAKNFREFRKFEKSLQLYETALTCYKSVKGQLKVLNQMELTHKLKKRGAEYIKASRRHYDFALTHYKKNQISATQMNRVGIGHVRTVWTYESSAVAEKTLDELIPLLQPKISLQTAYWIKARLQEEKGDLKESLKYIDLALKEKNLNLSDYLSLYWQKFWDNYKSKNFQLAEQALREAIAVDDPDDARSRLYYWLLQLLEKKEKTPEIKKEITEIKDTLIKRYPLSFYTALVRKEKKISLPVSNLENINSEAYKKLPKHFDLELFKSLSKVSVVATQFYLKNFYNKHKRHISKSERFLIKRLLARHGDTFHLFLDIKAKPEVCSTPESPCMDLFPNPYQDIVKIASQKFKVPQELIYSIIRQESVFNPLAKSWADARGLMQMLPSLAKQVAPKAQVDYQSSLDLYNPTKNITLGTFHLRELFNSGPKSLVMALCSYNADHKKAMVWYKTRYKGNWLEFIEEIPYKETRNYNKLVLRNLLIYNYTSKSNLNKWFPKGL